MTSKLTSKNIDFESGGPTLGTTPLILSTGLKEPTVNSGNISINTGINTNFGLTGSFSINTGSSAGGDSGGITIGTGDATEISFTAGSTGDIDIKAGDVISPFGNSGGNINITAGNGGGLLGGINGGSVNISAAPGLGSISLNTGGGDLDITAVASGTGGLGPSVNITAGDGPSAFGSTGGNVNIFSGTGNGLGGGPGGNIVLQAANNAGDCSIIGGTGGGDCFVTAGNGNVVLPSGGNCSISAGDSLAGTPGGNVSLIVGQAVSPDDPGYLFLGDTGLSSRIISRGIAPNISSGVINEASTDVSGTISGIPSSGSTTVTFANPYNGSTIVNVLLTPIGAPITAGRYPYVTSPTSTSFIINNPDTGTISVSYFVISNV